MDPGYTPPSENPACGASGNEFFVLGDDYNGSRQFTQVLNTDTYEWRVGPSLPIGDDYWIGKAGYTPWEDTFLIIGGETEAKYKAEIWMYIPESDQFEEISLQLDDPPEGSPISAFVYDYPDCYFAPVSD